MAIFTRGPGRSRGTRPFGWPCWAGRFGWMGGPGFVSGSGFVSGPRFPIPRDDRNVSTIHEGFWFVIYLNR